LYASIHHKYKPKARQTDILQIYNKSKPKKEEKNTIRKNVIITSLAPLSGPCGSDNYKNSDDYNYMKI